MLELLSLTMDTRVGQNSMNEFSGMPEMQWKHWLCGIYNKECCVMYCSMWIVWYIFFILLKSAVNLRTYVHTYISPQEPVGRHLIAHHCGERLHVEEIAGAVLVSWNHNGLCLDSDSIHLTHSSSRAALLWGLLQSPGLGHLFSLTLDALFMSFAIDLITSGKSGRVGSPGLTARPWVWIPALLWTGSMTHLRYGTQPFCASLSHL